MKCWKIYLMKCWKNISWNVEKYISWNVEKYISWNVEKYISWNVEKYLFLQGLIYYPGDILDYVSLEIQHKNRKLLGQKISIQFPKIFHTFFATINCSNIGTLIFIFVEN